MSDTVWASLISIIPSLAVLLVTAILLIIYRIEIRRAVSSLAWRLKSGAYVKVSSFELGATYIDPQKAEAKHSGILEVKKDKGDTRYNERERYYRPYLNQWIQPDPIVSDPYTPADWNRYAYVRNNPINYTDPSGQCIDTDLDGKCDWWPRPVRSFAPYAAPSLSTDPLSVFDLLDDYAGCAPRPPAYEQVVATEIRRIEQRYGVRLGVDETNGKVGEWRLDALGVVENALFTVDTRLRNAIDDAVWRDAESGRRLSLPRPGAIFRYLFSPLEFLRGPIDEKYYPGHRWFGKAEAGQRIYLYGLSEQWRSGTMFEIILHELGHILDQRAPSRYSGTMARSRSIQPIIAFIQQNEDYPEEGRPTKIYEASGLGINQRSGENTGEIWADVFASWAAGSFGREPFASSWRDFIERLMSDVATSIALGL